MALDPRIALAVKVPDVGSIFSNVLTNLGEFQRQSQSAELQPLRNQLLQAQLGGREASTEAQQFTNFSNRDQARIRSVSDFARTVKPLLDQGDTQGVLQLAEARKIQLQNNPNVDGNETQGLIDLLAGGGINEFQEARALVNQAIQLGDQQLSQGQTARTREFNNAVRVAQDPNSTQLEKDAAGVFLGTTARKATSAQERVLESEDLTTKAINLEGGKSGAKEAARLGEQLETQPLITTAVGTAKLEPALRMETQKANIRRMSELQSGEKTRNASVKKASQFLRALRSGNAQSGATRTAASFVPGVFTSQAQFDERFNAFAEVAARQQLKASGEIRPTDADVEGMKRAMFGVGRDEQTNIQLLEEFISAQQDQTDELDDLKESRKNKTLDQFGADPQPQEQEGQFSGFKIIGVE